MKSSDFHLFSLKFGTILMPSINKRNSIPFNEYKVGTETYESGQISTVEVFVKQKEPELVLEDVYSYVAEQIGSSRNGFEIMSRADISEYEHTRNGEKLIKYVLRVK
jgi:hypothetical protein